MGLFFLVAAADDPHRRPRDDLRGHGHGPDRRRRRGRQGPLAPTSSTASRRRPTSGSTSAATRSGDELRDAVERGFVEFGLAIPAGYDAALRAGGAGAGRDRRPADHERRERRPRRPSTAPSPARPRSSGRPGSRRPRTGITFEQALAAAPASDGRRSPASPSPSSRWATITVEPERLRRRRPEPGHPVHVPDRR